METPNNSIVSKASYEVSRISRSGRVLKRSSKLLDFQSSDVVENKKSRRVGRPPRYSGRGRPSNAVRAQRNLAAGLEDFSNDGLELSVGGAVDNSFIDLDVDEALSRQSANSENHLLVAPDSDVELDNLVADLVEGVEAESLLSGGDHLNNGNDTRVRQSLYMIEKSNKRKMLKDGKIVTGKTERKDKGRPRFTAYSMWARELRKSGKLGNNQESDFSSTQRRLAELWANVSMKEKNAWRRKAKKLSSREREKDKIVVDTETSIKSSSLSSPLRSSSSNSKSNSSNFLNRATTSRTKKLAAEKEQAAAAAKKFDGKYSDPSTPTRRRRRNSHRVSNKSTVMANGHTPTTSKGVEVKTAVKTLSSSNSSNSINSSSSSLPPPNIEPVDAAAHLKLLGESLSIIGEKLKEHDGEIALSGSLSVLLDSLLCSLGPLMCLTAHIPGLEKNKQLSSNLKSTLDNIAYVMPGL